MKEAEVRYPNIEKVAGTPSSLSKVQGVLRKSPEDRDNRPTSQENIATIKNVKMDISLVS